jgi:ABC-type lipoprotein release transport system permease subunit
VVALAAADVLNGLVFGVSTRAPGVYAAAAGLVFLLSVLATWVPAERAASTDPMGALRAE